jgi:membrane peptidoglycan carboxypeptidase
MPEVAKKMVEDGVVTQEEVEALQKKALEDQQNNRPPAELKVSSGETNESFLQVTSLFTNK